MRLRPKHFILTMASVGLGLGLGVEGFMKREVAGPVPFLMSVSGALEKREQTQLKRGYLPTARIVSTIAVELACLKLWE